MRKVCLSMHATESTLEGQVKKRNAHQENKSLSYITALEIEGKTNEKPNLYESLFQRFQASSICLQHWLRTREFDIT